MSDDILFAPEPTDAELRTVATLVRRLAELQAAKDRQEADLKATNKALQQLSEVDLPEALAAAGHTCPSKATIAGIRFDFSEKFRCGQLSDQPSKDGKSPANPDGLRWLDEEGHGDLIKRMIAVALPTESTAVAEEILAYLRAHRAANIFTIANQNTVHAQTLAAFVREQIEAGEDIPLDTLKVARVRSVKVIT